MKIINLYILLGIFFPIECLFKVNHKNIFDYFFKNPATRCKCACGIPNREGRLLGGEYLRGHEFPWLVTIPIRGITSASGVLINDQYVLTAASALTGTTPYDVKVTLGQYDACIPDISSVNMSVESVLIHPDFNPSNSAHDLALLRLASVASLDRRVRPICLPTPGTNYIGQVATVVSWAESKTEATCRPRKIGLPVLGVDECIKSISKNQTLSSDNGCAGVIGGPSYICKSDVGVPISFRNYQGFYELIGIFTGKNECDLEPSTAVYTKINANIKWILHNTNNACYCSKV